MQPSTHRTDPLPNTDSPLHTHTQITPESHPHISQCSDGTSYIIRSGVHGKLIEVRRARFVVACGDGAPPPPTMTVVQ